MEISRNKQHYYIMTVIYNELTDFNYASNEVSRNALNLASELCECPVEELPPYMSNCINISLASYQEIVTAFSKNLKNWKWERLPLLTQAILMMSYTHYYKMEKVDKRIVINIAVDLAKEYIEEAQAKFINAILDKTLD